VILERAIFAVKPGTAKDFEAAYAKARKLIEAAKGCRKAEMRRGIENPDSFILLVLWDAVDDHMKCFRESPAFTEWRALLSPFFASPPAMEHYEAPL
jgi:heme-degrading monooxygenase HmoA